MLFVGNLQDFCKNAMKNCSLVLVLCHNGKIPILTLRCDGNSRCFSHQTCEFGHLGLAWGLSHCRCQFSLSLLWVHNVARQWWENSSTKFKTHFSAKLSGANEIHFWLSWHQSTAAKVSKTYLPNLRLILHQDIPLLSTVLFP